VSAAALRVVTAAPGDAAEPPRERRTLEAPDARALCPACSQLMDRHDVGGAFGITLDLCRGHGVWLDAGELETLRALARSPDAARLAAELAASPHVRAIPFGDARWWVEPARDPDEALVVLLAGAVGVLFLRP
jgi:Zn-finger nucleic acid-binding protein